MSQGLEQQWEKQLIHYFVSSYKDSGDASHDLSHFKRVYHTAKDIAAMEPAPVDPLVILAAAYLHDLVLLPKNHPDSNLSSRYSAEKAKDVLQLMRFPLEKIEDVCHAIETHSFSAKLQPKTMEAKVIQDADRMEALGALGTLRTFYVSGRLGRAAYDLNDLHAERRPLDDKRFGLDHFYLKLFKIPALLQTEAGRRLAEKRAVFLHDFVKELEVNIKEGEGGALAVVEACCQAGRQGRQLFDSADPMASKRSLATHHYVIDQLIALKEKYPSFLPKFLTQFKLDIHVFP